MKTIHVPGVFEAVLGALHQALADGELTPGQRIRESILASEMNISRTILREACRRLESDGLVYRIPNRGVYVTNIGPEDIREIFALRAAVEGLCIREVIARHPEETAERCTRLVEAMRQRYRAGKKKEVSDLGYRVHETICLASGGQRLIRVWNTLNIQMQMCSVLLWKHDLLPEPIMFHEDLVEALRSGDPDRAEAIVKDHIHATQAVLLEYMAKLGTSGSAGRQLCEGGSEYGKASRDRNHVSGPVAGGCFDGPGCPNQAVCRRDDQGPPV